MTPIRLRPGRKAGRTLYLITGEDPDQHQLVGLVDTPELAEAICARSTAKPHTDYGVEYTYPDQPPLVVAYSSRSEAERVAATKDSFAARRVVERTSWSTDWRDIRSDDGEVSRG